MKRVRIPGQKGFIVKTLSWISGALLLLLAVLLADRFGLFNQIKVLITQVLGLEFVRTNRLLSALIGMFLLIAIAAFFKSNQAKKIKDIFKYVIIICLTILAIFDYNLFTAHRVQTTTDKVQEVVNVIENTTPEQRIDTIVYHGSRVVDRVENVLDSVTINKIESNYEQRELPVNPTVMTNAWRSRLEEKVNN